jgi:putative ABC transport system permease protein
VAWLPQDCRYALRRLDRDRRFALLAIFALALGIGATTVVFSIFHSLFVDPYAAKDTQRWAIPSVHDASSNDPEGNPWFSIPAYIAIRDQNHVFDKIVASYHVDVVYDHGGGAHDVMGQYLTADSFQFFGVPAFLGRGITPEDGKPGAPPVFVIGYNLWKSEFNSDPSVVGRSFTLNAKPRTLVGVMPKRFLAGGVPIWLPLDSTQGAEDTTWPNGDPVYLYPLARLKPGVSLKSAAADIEVITRQLAKTYPKDFPTHFTVSMEWAANSLMGQFKYMLYAIVASVGLLLLIACSNVASLLLVRATAREKEMAIRASLGARRGRLIKQLLVESFVLAAVGCLVGCVLAFFSLRWVAAAIPPDRISGEAVIGLNPIALAFSIGATFLTTLLCGLAPALHATRGDLQAKLASCGKGGSGGFRHAKLRAALVVLQVAFSITLLVGAGLMMRTFIAMSNVRVGFNPKTVICAQLAIPRGRYDTAVQKQVLVEKILERVKALPGVAAVTPSGSWPPLFGNSVTDVTIAGKIHSDQWSTMVDPCGEDYFKTLGIRLLTGRLLSHTDIVAGRSVAVVNQTLATKYFGGRDVTGQLIQFNQLQLLGPSHNGFFEIIGVVADFKNQGVQEPTLPEAFVPYTSATWGDPRILTRATVDPRSLLTAIRREVWAVDPNVAVSTDGSLQDLLDLYEYKAPKFGLVSMTAFASTGLALALVGIFATVAYTVSLQIHEIGIRIALGAQQGDILRMVLKQGFTLIVIGVAVGLFASFGLTRLLASQIWGIHSVDLWTFSSVVVFIAVTGFSACLLPARRASRVDPMVALRNE